MFNTVLSFWDFCWILLIVGLAVSSLTVYLKPRERARLSRIERKLDLLLGYAGLTYDPKTDVPAAVIEALERNDKLAAIKCYREATGVGLAEAKNFVEELQANPRL